MKDIYPRLIETQYNNKLSKSKPGQYLDGWLLCNIKYSK